MQYIIMDLEWNTAYSKSHSCYVNEIIEFGAVKLNSDLETVSNFSEFVRPTIQKNINSRVKKLTSITTQDVSHADNFQVVSGNFSDWVGDTSDQVIMSWGEMDIRTLIDNDRYYFGNPVIPYVSQYLDLQAYFMAQKKLPRSQQIGLSSAAEMVHTDPEKFTHHRALGDSELTAECFRAVYEPDSFRSSVQECGNEFYKRLLFHPYIISDIKDKMVDHAALSCQCIECGKPARPTSDWRFANSAFHANFICPDCQTKYRTNVQFRRMYDQVMTKKTVVKMKSNGKQQG